MSNDSYEDLDRSIIKWQKQSLSYLIKHVEEKILSLSLSLSLET